MAYMGITPLNVTLLSTSLLGQACLGGWLITNLDRSRIPSVPLLLGPGLILGGPISYLLFQIAGRGRLGIAAVCIAGAFAFFRLGYLRPAQSHEYISNQVWIPGQIVSLAAVTLSSEFVELLPVAAAGLVYGFLTLRPERVPRWTTRIAALLCIAVCLTAFLLRRDYWWLITDDYQHIEIIMRHLSKSSPFDNWGAFNYGTNYHWLSYAWGGLLNEVSVNEGHFTTMTRVVPALYSLSLAASLFHISHLVSPSGWKRLNAIPIWMVIAFIPLDWSGTSTGGVYAVLAAFVAVVVQLAFLSGRSSFRTAITVGGFLAVLALTKVPAVFSILLFLGLVCVGMMSSHLKKRSTKLLFTVLGGLAVLLVCFASLFALSRLTGEEFRFAMRNPALGQIGEIHLPLTIILLVVSRVWLWWLVLSTFIRNFGGSEPNRVRLVAGLGVLFLVIGLLLEMFISGSADNYKYFSTPMYFMATVSLLFTATPNKFAVSHSLRNTVLFITIVPTVVVSLWWGLLGGGSDVWAWIQKVAPSIVSSYIPLVDFVTSDTRFIASIVFLVISTLGWRIGLPRISSSLVVGVLVALSLFNYVPDWKHDFQRTRSTLEIETILGSAESRRVGEWLTNNTAESDLVATNNLVTKTGSPASDFSLAVWSERTFLVIGPRFFRGDSADLQAAVELSNMWANEPDQRLCNELRSQNVKWFVVNLLLTNNRDWTVCAREQYRSQPFVVLQVLPAEADA